MHIGHHRSGPPVAFHAHTVDSVLPIVKQHRLFGPQVSGLVKHITVKTLRVTLVVHPAVPQAQPRHRLVQHLNQQTVQLPAGNHHGHDPLRSGHQGQKSQTPLHEQGQQRHRLIGFPIHQHLPARHRQPYQAFHQNGLLGILLGKTQRLPAEKPLPRTLALAQHGGNIIMFLPRHTGQSLHLAVLRQIRIADLGKSIPQIIPYNNLIPCPSQHNTTSNSLNAAYLNRNNCRL